MTTSYTQPMRASPHDFAPYSDPRKRDCVRCGLPKAAAVHRSEALADRDADRLNEMARDEL